MKYNFSICGYCAPKPNPFVRTIMNIYLSDNKLFLNHGTCYKYTLQKHRHAQDTLIGQ